MRKIALQLYTVRETLRHDFVGTLKQIAEMGYAGVEAAGNLGGMRAPDLAVILSDLGLSLVSGHLSLAGVTHGFERTLEDYATLGARYVGLAFVAEEHRRDAGGYHRLARILDTAASQCIKHGIGFFHHNHDFEFRQFDGRYGLDILLEESESKQVKSELDVFWATRAGVDPAAYMRKLDGQAPLIHLKDMTSDDARTFAIIGEGCIDFEPILAAGDATGVDWYIVEQDQCPKGELVSAQASLNYVRSRGWF